MNKKLLAKNLYDQGLTIEAISQKLGIKKKTVRNYIAELKHIHNTNNDKNELNIKQELTIEHLKTKISKIQSKYTTLLKYNGFVNEITENILNKVQTYTYNFTTYAEEQHDLQNEALCLLLSDFHYGETIIPEQCFLGDNYDLSNIHNRLNIIYNTLCDIQKRHLYETLYIALLGDFVSGIIHEDLLLYSENITTQVFQCSELLINFILNIKNKFKNIYIFGVIGNHGRLTKNIVYKNKINNFDYLIYKIIEQKCNNIPNITFNFPKKDLFILNIQNHNFLFQHGDIGTKFKTDFIHSTINADKNITLSTMAQKNIYIHYHIMAHFHTFTILNKPNGKIILNGSMKGTDEYIINTQMKIVTPSQTIFCISPKYGITWIKEINLMNHLNTNIHN